MCLFLINHSTCHVQPLVAHGLKIYLNIFILCSCPFQYRRSWDWRKPAVLRNGGIGREYNLKKPYFGLEMGSGIGGEAVLAGAVLGGAVLGGALLGGTTVHN